MQNLRNKFFHWTESDIAAWEGIRARGLPRFVGWYGIRLFGGLMFALLGGAAVLLWVVALLTGQKPSFDVLLLQLLLVAALCLSGGLAAGLLTWALEESVYQKIRKERDTL